MFQFPVTVPIRDNESVYSMDVTVAIDEIAYVKPLLDNTPSNGVESLTSTHLYPLTEIGFVDGRKLPVLETPAIINRYLDAYKTLDEFFTTRHETEGESEEWGVVVPLFRPPTCDTSAGSTPD